VLLTPGRHPIWAFCVTQHLYALLRLGRHAEALEVGRNYLRMAHEQRLGLGDVGILVQLADAESSLGDYASAIAHIDRAIEKWSFGGGRGVHLAEAYEIRALIALRMSDRKDFEHYAGLCEAQYQVGRHGPLLAKHRKLLHDARKVGLIEPEKPASVREGVGGSTSTAQSVVELQTAISTVFSQARTADQRTAQALKLLTKQSRCRAGCLYLLKRHGATLVAKLGSLPGLFDLDVRVQQFLLEQTSARESTMTQAVEADPVARGWSLDERSQTEPGGFSWTATESSGTRVVPFLLSHPHRNGTAVTGVAVMLVAPGAPLRVPARLLQALSKAFEESGDAELQLLTEA